MGGHVAGGHVAKVTWGGRAAGVISSIGSDVALDRGRYDEEWTARPNVIGAQTARSGDAEWIRGS